MDRLFSEKIGEMKNMEAKHTEEKLQIVKPYEDEIRKLKEALRDR